MNSTNRPPFKTLFGSEVLADEITAKNPADLMLALLAVSLIYGIDRTERAIKATYSKTQAEQVIEMFNQTLRLLPKGQWKIQA